MSEQQGKQKAEEALRAAGFERRDGWGNGRWMRGVSRPSSEVIDVCTLHGDGLFELNQVGQLADLPALLKPITKEQLEETLGRHPLHKLDGLDKLDNA